MKKECKTVLVTGAASGIGLAITEYLLKKGDRVIATDINKDGLHKIPQSELLTTYFLDVTNLDSINEVYERIKEKFTGLDGLVNNAGLFVGGPLVEIDENKIKKIFSVNVLGVFNVTKNLFPLLFEKKGRIINIGSESRRFAFPLNGPYTMTKYALEAFSDSLRRELLFHDMKVVHLQIGAMKTPLLYQTFCSYAEDIDFENSLFQKQLELVTKVCEKEMKTSADPILVAKAVYKALHKKKTKARYRIKNNKFRRFLEFLPTSIVDHAMKKFLK